MSNETKKKPFYKKWWFWTIIVVLIIGVAVGGEGEDSSNGSNSSNNNTSDSSSSNNPSENKNDKKAENTANIGTPLKVEDVEFTVNGISTASNVGGQFGVDAQGVFLLVDVTVKNLGKEAITTDSSFFKLLVEDMEFEADSTATIYAGDNPNANFFLESINPTLSLTGTVVFDVSQSVVDSSDLLLQVQTGIWGTETGVISLK